MPIELYIGPMRSGKTSYMVGKFMRFIDSPITEKGVLISSALDNREKKDVISTHSSSSSKLSQDDERYRSFLVKDLSEVTLNEDEIFVGIDECQFIENVIPTCLKWLTENRKRIILISGLDSDFKQKPFNRTLDIIPYASVVKKFTAICEKCKNMETPAIFTALKENISTDTNILPGNEWYITVCMNCQI